MLHVSAYFLLRRHVKRCTKQCLLWQDPGGADSHLCTSVNLIMVPASYNLPSNSLKIDVGALVYVAPLAFRGHTVIASCNVPRCLSATIDAARQTTESFDNM
jgi:hypothetical protein